MEIQGAKSVARDFQACFDQFETSAMEDAVAAHCAPGAIWRGMYPFAGNDTVQAALGAFWGPLANAFTGLRRREDVFLAGKNDVDGGQSVWVCSMGNLAGLFDHELAGIPPTGRLAFLRYAEFYRVEGGKIAETALFTDLIGLMHQAGCYPLPPMTGAFFQYPGPESHDGQLSSAQDPAETSRTLALVNAMIEDLRGLNGLDEYECPPEILRRTWHEDMIWYGPAGIGASYTIARYQAQHQHPFRRNLVEKAYNGHVARIAEGNYCAFFGWANLRNRNAGGFLGLPAAREPAEMRIVDVYRRRGDRLAENWVFIDLPHYLAQQGLDVFERMKLLRPPAV
ncbi:MAG: ester cyclase [Pseudomonadota bacterium]